MLCGLITAYLLDDYYFSVRNVFICHTDNESRDPQTKDRASELSSMLVPISIVMVQRFLLFSETSSIYTLRISIAADQNT